MGETDATIFRLQLPSGPAASAAARTFVREHAAGLPADRCQDAQLLASELVTNAVLHGRPSITMVINLEPPLMSVSVHDEGERIPDTQTQLPARDDALGGRGLVLVHSIASSWGVIRDERAPGKTVWFRLDPITAAS